MVKLVDEGRVTGNTCVSCMYAQIYLKVMSFPQAFETFWKKCSEEVVKTGDTCRYPKVPTLSVEATLFLVLLSG